MSINLDAAEAGFDMSGRVAIVTGGGTGIGLYLATGLAKNGATVYIVGRRLEVLEKAAKSFRGSGSLIPFQMDVTNEESIKKGVQMLSEREGKVDILINNAGTNVPSSQPDHATKGLEYFKQGKLPYELETFEGWSDMFKLNTFAPFFVTTAFMDLLIEGASSCAAKKTSVVINISSVATTLKAAYPGNSLSYAFTKRALEQISTFMAADLAQRKIPVRIVALAPGIFPSEIFDQLEGSETFHTQAPPNYISPVPLLRWGKYVPIFSHPLSLSFCSIYSTCYAPRPEEIAMSANYLVANEYVNGIVLPVDGGFTLVNL
ncbi:hypothetical protein GYMLUDRAFT_568329 [Collybiopsis luxurians FD-317 M1]|uniref:NAD(P)-binding protein n=1 Tax=Collybiopsis luxurians FD-317 M1 TaxID=944289 RepID=A0A0D0CR44_9AGAR|nr:hypothetical protein GYMLUDRAFT_568329 [Collybiopsis luxurians FD-317 M1]